MSRPGGAHGRGVAAELARGLLDLGDGHHLAWEAAGHPGAPAAVVLHGGPGSGRSPGATAWFDPRRHLVVQYDQRGCGASRPHAGDPAMDLTPVTSGRLVADLDRLRAHLELERWLVVGHSWGTTLALAYALEHPDRTAGLVLAGVTTTRRAEVDWVCGGVADLVPEAWRRLWAELAVDPPSGPTAGIEAVERVRRLVEGDDAERRAAAARAWTTWDWATAAPGGEPLPARWRDPAFQLARTRLLAHLFTQEHDLLAGSLLARAGELAGVPGVLVQGALDRQAPADTARALHRAWPGSELVVVEGGGHGGPTLEAPMAEAVARLGRR